MKIKNANEVKVGDVMVVGGITWTRVNEDNIYSEWKDETRRRCPRYLHVDELQDLIDHGFEVTRKVEPVVMEGIVHAPTTCSRPWLDISGNEKDKLRDLHHKARVRVTVEPIE